MKGKHHTRPFIATLTALPSITFIFVILTASIAACNLPFINQSNATQEISDKNARMYQMYFDSSPNPALNELQVRRFIGHLHFADIADIFGDIQSLPQDQDCNYVGGPVEHEGVIWYITVTPDLVGVNLISIAPDGTRSSAFDLDGDRIVDILDILFSDSRRISIVTELMGLDVLKLRLQGLDPLCNTELIRQLGLPNFGCNETGDGSSGGGGFGPGYGILDPIDAICSEYDTSPMAGLLALDATRGYDSGRIYRTSRHTEANFDSEGAGIFRYVETYVTRDANTGEILRIQKTIVDMYVNDDASAQYVVQVVHETVDADGIGTRTTQRYQPNGMPDGEPENQDILVNTDDMDETGYDEEDSSPPPEGPTFDSSQVYDPSDHGPESEGDPGPEGDDSQIAAFCQRRANHQSGLEQAANEDPSSMSVSCGDLVGAPSSAHCNIIEWARLEDFRSLVEPPSADEGCDPFDDPERRCEAESIQEQMRRRVHGMTAELWSLDTPELDICPQVVCDPSNAVELQTYTSGGINIACPSITETPTLAPSEENCPPGTYYAPVTNRCIAINVPSGGDGDGDGGGGSCTLSVSTCSVQGQSFDANQCKCVDIQ